MLNRRSEMAGMLACVCIALLCVMLPAQAATTQVQIVRYADDGTTILNETTVNYTWMMNNLPVLGDGITHYYHQGPVFVDDPDPEVEEQLRWNPEEDTNVLEKDMGAVKGTNLKDLCDLVGGMAEGEEVKILASDGWNMLFNYTNVYEYNTSREGPMVLCWYQNGNYPDSGYTDGIRLIWFANNDTNTLGPDNTSVHAFGNWNWHEAADSKYWYYYREGNCTLGCNFLTCECYPTTTGLSGYWVNRVYIYSNEAPPLCGDVNADNDVTVYDTTLLKLYIGAVPGWEPGDKWASDVNCDGDITVYDTTLLKLYIGAVPGWPLNCCGG